MVFLKKTSTSNSNGINFGYVSSVSSLYELPLVCSAKVFVRWYFFVPPKKRSPFFNFFFSPHPVYMLKNIGVRYSLKNDQKSRFLPLLELRDTLNCVTSKTSLKLSNVRQPVTSAVLLAGHNKFFTLSLGSFYRLKQLLGNNNDEVSNADCANIANSPFFRFCNTSVVTKMYLGWRKSATSNKLFAGSSKVIAPIRSEFTSINPLFKRYYYLLRRRVPKKKKKVLTKMVSLSTANIVYIRLTLTVNNLIVTVTRGDGSVLFVRSVGYENFVNSQKRSFTSCWQLGLQIGRLLRRIPSFRDRFFFFSFRGILKDRRVRGFFRGFRQMGIPLYFIFFRPAISYNGCRAPHYARTGRRYKFYF